MACVSCNCPNAMRMPCGHFYCKNCVTYLATHSLKDRSLIPLKCCTFPLPYYQITLSLTSEQLLKYNEFNDYLPSNSKIDSELAQFVERKGWKLCPTCGIAIEKREWCNKMKCVVCKEVFCYVCSLKSISGGGCSCPV